MVEDQGQSAATQTPTQVPTPAPKPTLYVCHGDDGGPRIHPCRRVQEAMRAAGIEYDKVVAAHGNPIPFLRKGSREELRQATGETKLPALKLPDGTVLTHSRAILSWIKDQA
jgi:glutathione S-transferase